MLPIAIAWECAANTRLEGDKQVIEQEGVSISGGGANIHIFGTGNIFVGETINVGGAQDGVTMQFKGRCMSVSHSLKRQLSAGSGDVALYTISSRPSSILVPKVRLTSTPLTD